MRITILIIFILCLTVNPFVGNSQITFEKSQKELINIGKVGTINAFVREINTDSIFVVWKVSDLKATGSDNTFMAYESETHNIEFKATYSDLENLASWIKKRKKTNTGGAVSLGEWELSYVQKVLGVPIFMFTGSTGNFEIGISNQMRKRLMERKHIDKAINKYKERKQREEKRKAKFKSKG